MTFKALKIPKGKLELKQNTVLDYYVAMNPLPTSALKDSYYNGTLVFDVTGLNKFLKHK